MNIKFCLVAGAAVACVVMSGCKAPKAQSADRPVKPAPRISEPAPAPAPAPKAVKPAPAPAPYAKSWRLSFRNDLIFFICYPFCS